MNPREFAERSLLGVLLLQPGQVSALADWLAPEDFYRHAHQLIYRELRDLVTKAHTRASAMAAAGPGEPHEVPGADPVAVYDRIQASGQLGASAITAPYLHTLMATVPSLARAQPEQYALMVLEASIRRELAEDGIRVGQTATSAPDLAHMLDAVDTALNRVTEAGRRWESALRGEPHLPAPAGRVGHAGRVGGGVRMWLDDAIEPPDPAWLAQAERGLLGAVLLHDPQLLDRLTGQLDPDDFAHPRVAASYRAALHLHATAAATGRQVDVVTVAWQQQLDQDTHGPGLDPDELLEAATFPAGDPDYLAELVMRASLVRLTHTAAGAVQQAATHPQLHPGQLLAATRAAYETVTTAAARMAGNAGPGVQRIPTQQHDSPTPARGSAEAVRLAAQAFTTTRSGRDLGRAGSARAPAAARRAVRPHRQDVERG